MRTKKRPLPKEEAEAPEALDLLIDRVELRLDGIQLFIKLPT
jgi:hypothetical protein